MRLHYILLVAAATLLACHDVVSANVNSGETKLSTVNEKYDPDDEDEDEIDEERGIAASAVRQFLLRRGAISKEVSQHLKTSGLSAKAIASMYPKYMKIFKVKSV